MIPLPLSRSGRPLREQRDGPEPASTFGPAVARRSEPILRPLAAVALALTLTLTASAQFEVKGGAFNTLYRGTVPNAANNTPPIQPTQPQFMAQAVTGGGHQAIAESATVANRYPRQTYVVAGTSTPTGAAIVHVRASFGFGFASGAPRYLFGDFINPPTRDAAGAELAANSTYWRAEPVKPGETFVHAEGPQDAGPHIPANAALSYYYSPHAERVLASQSGRVAITWVSRVPVTIGPTGTDAQLRYRFRDETFAVSAAPAKPTRTIYWTEKSFNGPIVTVPIVNIEWVNPIYHALFPKEVAEEFKPVGVSTNTDPSPVVKSTVWFDKPSGVGQLHAYNHEGRLLIEYLGKQKPGANSTYTFLGADILEVVRSAPTVNATVNLGEKITPRDADNRKLPLDGGTEWRASPVTSLVADGPAFYGTNLRPDGVVDYYAERENFMPDRVVFYWLERQDAAISAGAGSSIPPVNLLWPKAKNAYTMNWPTGLSAYAHNTVAATGSTAGNGVAFDAGQLPQLIFQDDNAQTEAKVDPATQRLAVDFSGSGDGLNRSLLRFTSGTDVWYVRLYTQADNRSGFQEADGAAAFDASATVGERIAPPSAAYSVAGHIEPGPGFSDSYAPAAYVDPLTAGIAAAERGAIIPVNAIPGNNRLKVWWFSKVTPPSAAFQPFYVPSKVGRYTISYPASPRQIILASNTGSDDLTPAEIAGQLYVQNDRLAAGFNPNEEHALMLSGRVYALRDDLNNTTATADYTSAPFVLLSYTSPTDQRPAMSAFQVLRETATIRFDYPITAGTIVQAPMPLAVLPLPLDAAGQSRNLELDGVADTAVFGTAPHAAPPAYTKFTFEDRKGNKWVFRGPHATGSPTFLMQFYYTMRDGFWIPGAATQPTVGTILPYLRPLASGVPQGDPISGTSLSITYRPVWPASAPTLRVAETLTLPKFGLPAVLPQASAEVFYQQSIATGGTTMPSVVLHDPIREKSFALGTANQLAALPPAILTTQSGGKTYFQNLPPHLQPRFYFDPLRGSKGALVLVGKFVDEIAGEDYLQLNTLSVSDRDSLVSLAENTSATERTLWAYAIDHLATNVETFVEDPAKLGTFKPNNAPVQVGPTTLPAITNADTAVVDYALTATGTGNGWVTMVFGNGRAFTPAGDPVSVQIFKVTPELYTGDLKILPAQNPLDEQVTLRHSGDFAARTEHYEFEWRSAPPQDSKAAPIYTSSQNLIPLPTWQFVQTPVAELPNAGEYLGATSASLPRTVTVNLLGFTGGTARPGLVAKSTAGIDFSTGIPAQVFLGADLGDHVGFVLYINGLAALAYNAPARFTNVAASTGLVSGGLTRQFAVHPGYFQKVADNRIEVALYSTADAGSPSVVNFQFHRATDVDLIEAGGSPWVKPNGTLSNEIVVGGSPTAPLGSPLLVMSDNYFTMRYRPKVGTGNMLAPGSDQSAVPWSRWLPPKLVEGWIKRVLAGINPFNQRVTDLANNAVNTDVSILTQAGTRWEGNIALTLENIDSVGLIEIYETLLNRAKALSVDAGYNYGPVNDALLLAAGSLNDLYTVLGHEAYADAANPTISVDDTTTGAEVNTARFSFEGQVSNVLEEELALLRGRDNSNTAVDVAPAYNRLYWNYTRGIDSGEAIYATNYNIREKAGSPTADGKLDAADAQRLFPQGHGDAYGHYLTALTGYYRLLTNPHFTWTPRAETVNVLGQTVQIDYFDERKFASAAANVARTAQQIVALTYRKSYKDDTAAGWSHFRDSKSTGSNPRHWGLDEWASRAAQGSYYHWIVGNALVPDHDTNSQHTGVQVIDRTTVPALQELPVACHSFQSTMDSANARLNPLGLSPGAIAFDISPSDLKTGKSHYEQVHERALRAVLNAKGAFDQAGKMTRLLRSQENQVDSSNSAIVDQEGAFVGQLIEIFGTPYPASVGPGKTYAQGYTGPDTQEWFIIDRPTGPEGAIVDASQPVTVSVPTLVNIHTFTSLSVNDIKDVYRKETAVKTLTIVPNRFVQYADVWAGPGASLGTRSVVGSLQQALSDAEQARIAMLAAATKLAAATDAFSRRKELYDEMVDSQVKRLAILGTTEAAVQVLKKAQLVLNTFNEEAKATAAAAKDVSDAMAEFPPQVQGVDNDTTSTLRAQALLTGAQTAQMAARTANEAMRNANFIDFFVDAILYSRDLGLEALGFNFEKRQAAYEFGLQCQELQQQFYEIAQTATALQRANENVRNLFAQGESLLQDRETFRQRAAALIQGYRTKDLTFRTFRNEALEQYRSLFDLASRYTYLAAKAYDYETGLLGGTAGQSVINSIVAARALGDLTGGTPQATVSTTGDAGLAGTMARLQADWSVAKSRLGINNPDTNGTVFSLRRELFRILGASTEDTAWQQTLEQHILSDVLADPDVAAACRNLRKADGSAVPGIVIPFSTTVQKGLNFFGLPLAVGDHSFSVSNYATKIYSVGVVLRGYVGMDAYATGTLNAAGPNTTAANGLSATPYVYLIPTGTDYLLAPPLGDTGAVRAFSVADQALPLPFNLGATAFSTTQFFNANGTLNEQPWILRKHQAFRPVSDPAFFYGAMPAEFTNARLVGRSVWNSGWKLVIPAFSLLNNEQEGLNRFAASVKDIELFLRTYSHSGN